MADLPTVRDVQAENTAGRFRSALHLLDLLPETGVHLWMRGVALHNLGSPQQAHAALDRARALLSGHDLGRTMIDQALFYTRDQRYARALELFVQAAKHFRNDPEMTVIVNANLGWLYLSRLQFQAAHHHLQIALQLGERTHSPERMGPRIVVSTLDRANGQLNSALLRAQSAVRASPGHPAAHLAYRCLAHAYRHSGDLTTAYEAQRQAAELAVADVLIRTERLILGVIATERGQTAPLEALQEGALPLDVTRALLHRAEQARRAGMDTRTRHLLVMATEQDEPFALWDEAPLLPDLFRAGRALGLALPLRPGHASVPDVLVGTLGRARLVVAGREIGGISVTALTLLAYLIMSGPSRLSVLDEELYGGIGVERAGSRVSSAIRTVNRWLGDPRAVRREEAVVSLSPDWTWRTDVQAVLTQEQAPTQRVFFPGVHSEWVNRIQRQLDELLS